MVNSLLVMAAVKSIEETLIANDIPFGIESSEAYKSYQWEWVRSDKQQLALRQAAPAIERILANEPYVFEKGGEPLFIRVNDKMRELEKESFGEILLERKDLDWRISLSVKSDAHVLTTMPVADRETDKFTPNASMVVNEIDDFGDRIFGVPCSNEYFDDMNEILMKIDTTHSETWSQKLTDEDFVYDNIITPMLRAFGAEVQRICSVHPEAPAKLLDYFYGKIDYYFINPIDRLEVTRIGAVNSHGGLGRIPDNDNHYTPVVKMPTELLDVRFATGKYGEVSKDTLQLAFDGGWSVCITIRTQYTVDEGRIFALSVYLPVTPFGSYRDQVKWEPEM